MLYFGSMLVYTWPGFRLKRQNGAGTRLFVPKGLASRPHPFCLEDIWFGPARQRFPHFVLKAQGWVQLNRGCMHLCIQHGPVMVDLFCLQEHCLVQLNVSCIHVLITPGLSYFMGWIWQTLS